MDRANSQVISFGAARHSPQDIALTKALNNRLVIRVEDEDDGSRQYYTVTNRRWAPQSREAWFIFGPVSA